MSAAPTGIRIARCRAFKLRDGSGLWSIAFDSSDRLIGVDLDDIVCVPESRARALARLWNESGRKPAPPKVPSPRGSRKAEIDHALKAARGLWGGSEVMLDPTRRQIKVVLAEGALAVDVDGDLVQWRSGGATHTFIGRAPTTKKGWTSLINECRRRTAPRLDESHVA